jgi:PIN domain nuclease of toxin-antitoxin system
MGGNDVIILDTHIFLWLNLQPGRVPENIIAILGKEERIGLAAISLWETAMLHSRRRIIVPGALRDWLRATIDSPRLAILPLTLEIAVQSESLPMHGDPADRLIAATAIEYDCPLATVDRRLIELPMVKTVS